MTDEEKPQQGADGRFLAGNTAWKKAVGIPKHSRKIERERKAMMREVSQKALEVANSVLTEKLGDVLDQLYEQAMSGDVKAMGLWLRHSAPVAPQAPKLVDSELLAEFQGESPETIIQLTTRAMAAGEVDVLMGKQLIDACKASIESAFTQKFKNIIKRMQRDNLSIQEVVPDLVRLADDMEPTLLEHDE